MTRPKPLSKTKQLRRQLRDAQAEAKKRYDALNLVASNKQRQIEALKSRIQSFGGTSVHETCPGDVYGVAINVDRRAVGNLKKTGR